MNTYSINIGLPTEATTYYILGATAPDLSIPLGILYDNTEKEISPRDLRDSILTLWSNSLIKQTSINSGVFTNYIGVDTENPTDKDVKNKIFIGKRAFSGTYSYTGSHDIMSNTLLNSDVDIFLFNTKRDTIQNNKTVVRLLSSTNSSLREVVSPYIQSEIISGTTSLSLDFINPTQTNGNIDIYSGNKSYPLVNTGTISVSNIIFPSVADSYGVGGATAASTGKLLFWNDGKLIWNNVNLPVLSSIGATGVPLNIFGTPVYVNNYPIELSDARYTPFPIGDIPIGITFSMVEMVEVLRRIVYTYLPPICTVTLLPPYVSGYVEVGTSPLVKLNYQITKRTLPTLVSGLSNMIPGSVPAITANGQVTISGTANGIVISPVTSTTTTFTVNVTDGTQSNSSSTTITGIYPYFYGFSSLSTMTTAGLATLNKLVEPLGDKTIDITGSGNLFFIYDSSYPDLDVVYDNVNNVIGGSSSSYNVTTLSSPTGLWASKQFKVYVWTGIPQIGPPSVNYQFKY